MVLREHIKQTVLIDNICGWLLCMVCVVVYVLAGVWVGLVPQGGFVYVNMYIYVYMYIRMYTYTRTRCPAEPEKATSVRSLPGLPALTVTVIVTVTVTVTACPNRSWSPP